MTVGRATWWSFMSARIEKENLVKTAKKVRNAMTMTTMVLVRTGIGGRVAAWGWPMRSSCQGLFFHTFYHTGSLKTKYGIMLLFVPDAPYTDYDHE